MCRFFSELLVENTSATVNLLLYTLMIGTTTLVYIDCCILFSYENYSGLEKNRSKILE